MRKSSDRDGTKRTNVFQSKGRIQKDPCPAIRRTADADGSPITERNESHCPRAVEGKKMTSERSQNCYMAQPKHRTEI